MSRRGMSGRRGAPTGHSLLLGAMICAVMGAAGCSAPRAPVPDLLPGQHGGAVFCGHEVPMGRAMPVAYRVKALHKPVTGTFTDGLIYLNLTDDCSQGATLSLSPESAATVSTLVAAPDGRPALVTVKPAAKHFTVFVRQGGERFPVRIELAAQ